MLGLGLLVFHGRRRLNGGRSSLANRRCHVGAVLRATRGHLADTSGLGSGSLRLGSSGTLLSDGCGNAGSGGTRQLSVGRIVEAGSDDRDTNLISEGIVDDVTEDDVGLGVGGLTHKLRRSEDLLQGEVGASLEEHEHAVRTVDRRFEQRRRNRALDSA